MSSILNGLWSFALLVALLFFVYAVLQIVSATYQEWRDFRRRRFTKDDAEMQAAFEAFVNRPVRRDDDHHS